MSKIHKKHGVWLAALAACMYAMVLFAPVVYADTDGTELQVTDQPEKLVIQLGPAWAGVEFELKTDVGVYPQPVVVSPEGVLSMELGGSKTYTLSCLSSPVAPPLPQAEGTAADEPGRPDSALEPTVSPDPSPESDTQETAMPGPDEQADASSGDGNLVRGIPNMHLFLFAGGLLICVGTLIAMRVLKNRRTRYYDEEEPEDDEY